MMLKNIFFISFYSYNLSCISFLLFLSTSLMTYIILPACAYAGIEEKYKEYSSEVNKLKDSVAKSTSSLAPEKVFDNYSSNPAPTKYYSEDSGGGTQNIKSDGIVKVALDNEGKAITESSKTRIQFKINTESEEIKNSKEIQKLASKNIKDTMNEPIGEKESQIDEIQTKYVTKTCNEEIRSFKRICEKSPFITIKEELYPGCQSRVQSSGKEECLIGTFGIGTHTTVVPKHLASRVEVAGSAHGYFYVTVINETTGQTLYNYTHMNNGVGFALSFSDTKDQTFRLIANRADGCCCEWPGYLTLYIDRKYRAPNIEWKETCHEI